MNNSQNSDIFCESEDFPAATSLDHVIGLISEEDVNLSQLCEYLDNAVGLLRLLCGFVTTLVESVSMDCQNMTTFPVETGKIILTVFGHCKNSETIYGPNIRCVEKQLKDLFRNCHELQLTYLMILGKNFVFDCAEIEQLDILIEALEINLKIGEIVQTLDVKTMAEQWKAYTVICEKYSDSLKNKHIYDNCTKVLCKMIDNNITTAVEVGKDDKMVLRSLKVANFAIKILVRVCNIFKHSTGRSYGHIFELLVHIYLNNPTYLEHKGMKTPEFLNSINNHIFAPTEILLKELLLDDKFCDDLHNMKMFKCEDERSLSFICMIVTVAKNVAQGNVAKNSKKSIIGSIFRWLPHGHIWFNMSLRFKSKESKTVGLFEHLLTHMLALSLTLDHEEMCYLEQVMYESILGIDCYKALFTLNLWELLSKLGPRQFVLSQLLSLCNIYQKLENCNMFLQSPQKHHLSQLINKLFRNVGVEDKIKVCKQFDINEDNNMSLWIALRIDSLPTEDATGIYNEHFMKNNIVEKLKKKIDTVFSAEIVYQEDIDSLTKLMKLCSTANYAEYDEDLQNCVLKAWSYLCSQSKKCLCRPVTRETVWFMNYVEALVSVTVVSRYIFQQNDNVVKVLHVVENLVDNADAELKLVLIDLLFRTSHYTIDDANQHLSRTLHQNIFKKLLLDCDIVKNKLFNELLKIHRNQNAEAILKELAKSDNYIQGSWNQFQIHGSVSQLNVQEQLSSTFNLKYNHKCLENTTIVLSDSETMVKSNSNTSNNFDFVDMDTLFDTESDSEPASKRLKLSSSEAEEILTRIEKEVTILTSVKENVPSGEFQIRIRDVCEKLLNIID